jgi:hypothetical protein
MIFFKYYFYYFLIDPFFPNPQRIPIACAADIHLEWFQR